MRSSNAIRALLSATALISLVSAPPARATWSHDPLVGVAVAPSGTNQLTADGMAVADGTGGVYASFTQQSGVNGNVVVQRLTASGVPAPGWPAAGVVVRSLPGAIYYPQLALDGSGGVLIVWTDMRTGAASPFAQRLNGSGVTQWAANGVQLGFSTGVFQGNTSLCADGSGGAWVAWEIDLSGADYDIYATHVTAGGIPSLQGISTPLNHQQIPHAASDGAGGCYIAFDDDRLGSYDVRLTHVNAAGAFIFSDLNLDNGAANDQWYNHVMADGAGGVYVDWLDDRAAPGSHDIYATHIDSGGGTHFGNWAFSGTALCTAAGTQSDGVLLSDGSGGMYAFWNDGRPVSPGAYGVHLAPNGVLYPGWTANGKAFNTFGGNPFAYPVADGSGGAILVMYDLRLGPQALFSERVTFAGNLAPISIYGGRVNLLQSYSIYTAVSDNAGGAFVLWNDSHTGPLQLYIQHLDNWAVLGDARPSSAGIKDVAADQGGAVRLKWNASWMDGDPDWGIQSYWIWRQSPASLAQAAVAAGEASWADGTDAAPTTAAITPLAGARATRLFRHDAASADGYAWEFLASQPANGSAQYTYVASTTSDSITGHNPSTVFMVEAHSLLDTRAFWQSAPDSGYSVDNLPPVAPAPFTGQYAAGTSSLHWGRNSEADLAGYRLYRGTTVGFVPGPGNLVSAQPDTGYADAAGAPYVYKLTAVDIHGNESAVAVLVPSGALGVDGDVPRELAFALASPNPSRTGAVLRVALPAPQQVRVAIYDAAGREVRLLEKGEHAAGVFTCAWIGDESGGAPAPSGIYFARLQAGRLEFVRRIALTR